MSPLIANSHIYIAQPPLYKVKRGKREIYVQNEEQLISFITKEGIDGTKVYDETNKKEIPPAKLKEVIDLLLQIEKISPALRRKGTTLEEYLKHISPEGKLPLYGIIREKEAHFFYTDKELASFMEQFNEEQTKKIEVKEFAESRQVEKIIGKLQENGMSANTLHVSEKPLYKLESDGEKQNLFSAPQILEKIKELGRKGLSIQRYKGLGEMNPEQLWETTMDPEKRTLVQIRLEDAYTADEIFGILMGNEVEPRREYIQTHALEVQNLDI